MAVVYSFVSFVSGSCCYTSGVDGERGQRWAIECPQFAGDCWDLMGTSGARPTGDGRAINGAWRRSKHAMRHARMDLPPYDEDAAVRWVAEGKLPSDEPLTGGG